MTSTKSDRLPYTQPPENCSIVLLSICRRKLVIHVRRRSSRPPAQSVDSFSLGSFCSFKHFNSFNHSASCSCSFAQSLLQFFLSFSTLSKQCSIASSIVITPSCSPSFLMLPPIRQTHTADRQIHNHHESLHHQVS